MMRLGEKLAIFVGVFFVLTFAACGGGGGGSGDDEQEGVETVIGTGQIEALPLPEKFRGSCLPIFIDDLSHVLYECGVGDAFNQYFLVAGDEPKILSAISSDSGLSVPGKTPSGLGGADIVVGTEPTIAEGQTQTRGYILTDGVISYPFGADTQNSFAAISTDGRNIIGFKGTEVKVFRDGKEIDLQKSPTAVTVIGGINDAGTFIGVKQEPTATGSELHGFVGDDRAITLMPQSGALLIEPKSINNAGDIVGSVETGESFDTGTGARSNLHQAFIYSRGQIKNLREGLSRSDASASFLNDKGVVIGEYRPVVEGKATGRKIPFIYSPNGGVRDLESLVLDTGWSELVIYGLNNQNEIVGFGKLDGVFRPFRIRLVDF